LSSIGTGLTAICVAITGALRGPLRKVNECVDELESARKTALNLIDQKRSERSAQETALEGEVNALKAKEASATEQLSAADTRVREVEVRSTRSTRVETLPSSYWLDPKPEITGSTWA
jgi:chromosome segregation ATPase